MGAQMRPSETDEEAALVARAKAGDMAAFETLAKRHGRGLYALCYRLTGAPQAAEDLVQETFIKAFSALGDFDEARPLFPWLRRIALNAGLNVLKSRKREEPLGDRNGRVRSPDFASSSPTPHDELQRNETGETLRRALKALPHKLRAVFILHVYDDLSYEDIGLTLGIPRGTVMSRLNRARRRLRAALSGPGQGRP